MNFWVRKFFLFSPGSTKVNNECKMSDNENCVLYHVVSCVMSRYVKRFINVLNICTLKCNMWIVH